MSCLVWPVPCCALSEEDKIALIGEAIELSGGVLFIDTSDMYGWGENERLIVSEGGVGATYAAEHPGGVHVL